MYKVPPPLLYASHPFCQRNEAPYRKAMNDARERVEGAVIHTSKSRPHSPTLHGSYVFSHVHETCHGRLDPAPYLESNHRTANQKRPYCDTKKNRTSKQNVTVP